MGALLSALSDAECLLLRTPLGPVYTRLGSGGDNHTEVTAD